MAKIPPTAVAVAAFSNMFSVGTVYALSTLQVELPRLLPDISPPACLAPFATACLGLSLGTRLSANLITALGSHRATTAGTVLWSLAMALTGYFLQQGTFLGILAASVLGGIGVGITYLAVIVMVAQGLPDQPLARSAIGPLGFSSGSAACVALSSYLQFASLDAQQLGQLVMRGGVVSALVAFMTAAVLRNGPFKIATGQKQVSPPRGQSIVGLSVLLFANAFPGMAAFSSLVPLAAQYGDNNHYIIASCMIALALGGLLAPDIHSALGAKHTFAAIFGLRGLLLTVLSQSNPGSASYLGLGTLLSVLFGHGVGFSVLPIIVKARNPELVCFYRTYARILPLWGLAGIAGALYQYAWMPKKGTTEGSYVYIGIMAGTASVFTFLLPPPFF